MPPTTEPDAATPALIIATGTSSRDTSNDRVAFQLDDDPHAYTAVRPKMAIFIEVTQVLADDSDVMGQATGLDNLLEEILDADSAAQLRTRFYDRADDLDIDALQPIIETLTGLWYGGPTGRPSGPAPSRARTGPRSTGRRRS